MLHHDDDVNGDDEDEGDGNYEEEDDKYYDNGDNDDDEDDFIFDGCPLIVAAPAVRSKRLLDGKRASFSRCCYHYIYCHSHSYILYIISYIRQSPFSLFVINIFIFTIIIIILSLAHIKQSPFGQMTKG